MGGTVKDMGKKRNHGSVTVEASFVVPIFLFFTLSMANLYMLLLAEAHIHQSLAEAANYVSAHSYLEYKAGQSDVADTVMINARFQNYLGEDYNVTHTIQGGKKGVVVTIKNNKDNPKQFHAKAVYMAAFHLPVLGTHYFMLTDEVKQKRFIGYSPEEKGDTYVYVTPERSVYHATRACTHLSLQYGSKSSREKGNYVPCHFCGQDGNDMGIIYVSRTTNVFHHKKTCSGLKRTVKRIKKEEAVGLSPCLRCGG